MRRSIYGIELANHPLHSGFGRIRINPPEPFEYDIRFQQA